MAVMESVAIRQRGGFDFAAHYDNLCALHNTCPVQAVKAHLSQRVLDINADRIR
jgi:centrosomal protein CEP78